MSQQPSGSSEPDPQRQRPLPYYSSVAHEARVYDYLLGGKDNFAVDREAAEQALKINPDAASTARANRAFLARATSYLVGEAGIRQFLDIGAGMPTNNNIHEVAQSFAPQSRVVYVDHDPIVLSHARALLTSAPQGRTDYIEADLREPERILAEAARTLDFGRPVAVVPGSYFVITHTASDIGGGEMVSMASRMTELMAQPSVPRSYEQVARFFAGLHMLEPGLVRVPEWRPDPDDDATARAQMWGGIGLKGLTPGRPVS
jgi:hypothetical protein